MRVAIHQPEYFPPLSFFHKALHVDRFILLDTVDFNRENCQHRAKIKGPQGPFWMTIPFRHRSPQRFREVKIARSGWWDRHQKSLQTCYGRAPFLHELLRVLEEQVTVLPYVKTVMGA